MAQVCLLTGLLLLPSPGILEAALVLRPQPYSPAPHLRLGAFPVHDWSQPSPVVHPTQKDADRMAAPLASIATSVFRRTLYWIAPRALIGEVLRLINADKPRSLTGQGVPVPGASATLISLEVPGLFFKTAADLNGLAKHNEGHMNRLIGYYFGGCLILFFIIAGLIQGREYLFANYGRSAAMPVEVIIFSLPVCFIALGVYLLWRHFFAKRIRKYQ